MKTFTHPAGKWLLATRNYSFLLVLILIICTSVFADTQPVEQWVARYNGPGNDGDHAYDLAVDNSGNVYVTGYSYGGSGTSYDYATVKYGPGGNQLWVARYNGPGNYLDYAYDLVVDNSGNVYVTGLSFGNDMMADYATIKYAPDGNQLWVARYNGPGNKYDYANAIAIDNSGNVYVTGASYDTGTSDDYATIKYSPDGNQLWVRRYNGPANNNDIPQNLAVDSSGNVYVTGYITVTVVDSNYDYATIKYSPDGNQLWVKRYNGPGNKGDQATTLAIDNSGNVYVTGASLNAVSGSSADYATVKYNSDGNQIWVARYNGDANLGDVAYALAVDSSHNVYVAGNSAVSDQNEDYATVKYDPDGNQLWVARYNGFDTGYERGSDLAVDGSGNVYVTGHSPGSGTDYDYATIKYSPDGNQLWLARYNGPVNGSDQATSLEVDNSGNVYVTGGGYGSGTGSDYVTIKYKQVYYIYVDTDATGTNDGSSWTNAYNYLQDALYAAPSGYEIWVAQGTYRPDEDTNNPDGNDSRTATFQLKNGVALYGGFPSGGGNWSSRDPNAHQTILSGDISVVDANYDNSYNVVTSTGNDSTAILDGFTVTKGNANYVDAYPYDRGAGMLNLSSSPTVNNCIFSDNSANVGGGGMLNKNSSSPTINNCTFTGNTTHYGYGGGMWNEVSNPTLTNCAFNDNMGVDGGGMANHIYANPTLTNCTFTGNSSSIYGGAIFNNWNSNTTLTNCTFNGNISLWLGGGIYNVESSLALTNCTFSGGSIIQGAGDINIVYGGEVIIEANSVVDLNDPYDPNAPYGTIYCNGLLRVKDNGILRHATVNVSRSSESPEFFGKLRIENAAQATDLDIYTDGDRFMDVDPCTFTGTIARNRIYVTITEGLNGSNEGVLEVRGLNLPSPPCDFNDPNVLACQIDDDNMPSFDTNSWTLERLELAAGAKVTLVDRFSSGNGYPEVLYVKDLVLGADCNLKVGFEHLYYTNLSGEPNSIIKGALTGFSLDNIDCDSNEEFQSRVGNNNYIDPVDPNLNRIQIERVTGLEPDPNGMMKMSNLDDPCSGDVISARAKGEFAPVSEDIIRIRLNYLFNTTDPCAQIVVYLADVPELLDHNDSNRSDHYFEAARIPAPPPPRPGSAGSGQFGNFEIYTSTGLLDLTNGTWIELELIEPGQSQFLAKGVGEMKYQATAGDTGDTHVYVDNWDSGVYCYHGICLDLDWDGEVEVSDFLIVVSGNGRGDPCCTDGCFSEDGYDDSYDSGSWDWTIDPDGRKNMCGKVPLGSGGETGLEAASGFGRFGASLNLLDLPDLNDLLICGKRGTTDGDTKLKDRLYVFDGDAVYLESLEPSSDRYNIRIVRGEGNDLYQINSENGVLHLDGTPIVPPGQTTCDTNEPRYNLPATVYVGVQKRWTNGEPDYFGRPVFDAAFDANFVYVVPVVVEPVGNESGAYAAAAKLQLDPTPPYYHVVKLYDGPLLSGDNQRQYRNTLREIELDAEGNVYVTNAHAFNASDILWKFEPGGAVVHRLDLDLNNPVVRAPAGMFVSGVTNVLYLTSSLYNNADPNSKVIHGFSTEDFNLVRTITVSGMQHVTGITEDPATGALWITGFSMNCVPPDYPSPLDLPFYDPYLAKVFFGEDDAYAVNISVADDLAMPLSIVWTGFRPAQERCGGADLSGNGNVNQSDFAKLAQYWLNTNCVAPSHCEGADLEPQVLPDGDVDLKDLDVMAEHWLDTGCLGP